MKVNSFELRLKLFPWGKSHMQITYPSIKLKYPGCFMTFWFASRPFILFLWKHNSFMSIYVFTRKNFVETLHYFSTTVIRIYFASLNLSANYHSADLAGDKNMAFLRFLCFLSVSHVLDFWGTLFILTIKIS